MAELATVARPYAEALFESCRDELGAAQEWLGALARVASSRDLLQFAANPKVGPDQVESLMAGALGEPLPERGANFLRTVIQNRRVAALPEMARQFDALVNRAENVTEAVVHTPFPLSDDELSGLQGTLEKRFGRRLQLRQEPDASLIGGVRVVAGDEVLDTSVKARLEQMRVALTS